MVDYPRVRSCFGRPLYTGCIIIGIICVVIGVLLEIWFFTNWFSKEPAKKDEKKDEEPAEEKVDPAQVGARPADVGVHPADEGVHPADEGVHPSGEEVDPAHVGARPADVGVHPADEGVHPSGEGEYPREEAREGANRSEMEDKEEEEGEKKEEEGCTRQGRRHFAYGVTFIFLGILVIVGVKEDAHWMILMFTWMILSLGIFIFCMGLSYLFKDASCTGVIDIMWGIIALVCGIIFSIVSLSFFREVKEATEYHLDDLLPPGVLPQEAEEYRKSERDARRASAGVE